MATGMIGRYQVKSEIARGGMATVYHAYDPRFEREVAIKVLPRTFMHDPSFKVRFEREAKMIALLEHPAIVPVYDFGEEEGQPYIVMRLMSGGTLTDRLRQGALSLVEVSQIVSRVAPALDAAHAHNIIHRDLKPSNFLFDQYGNAYLSDFGIARVTTAQSGATITGQTILGTPAYMSPEQVQGDRNIDGRSDIYSLGVMVFQMMTGQLPYNADTPAKLMVMHVLEPVPNILDMMPDLPAGCFSLILKAMAKDPADRFSTAGELATALEKIVKGETVTSIAGLGEVVIVKGKPAEKTTALPPKATVKIGASTAAVAVPKRSLALPVALGAIGVMGLVIVAVVALALIGRQGRGPLAFLAPPIPATAMPTLQEFTATSPAEQPSLTPSLVSIGDTPTLPQGVVELTQTAAALLAQASTALPATDTPMPLPSAPVIGGADKIAWLSDKDIYVANLDGTELVRLTEDKTDKTALQWAPDGKAIQYISGKCVFTVSLETSKIDIIICFNFVDYLKAFEVSPDGTRVALTIDNQLYIVPNDLQLLSQVQRRGDLTKIATCPDLAPYTRYFVKYARWSKDGNALAAVIMGNASGIGSADIIWVMPVNECNPNPRSIDQFPPPRFRPEEYAAAPMIQNFGWDGVNLFAMVTYIRNDGFGNLYIYNMDLHKARTEVNPVNGYCCYRDPHWSPDGTHLLLAFQKQGGDNTIQFYLIPYGTLGTGLSYTPLPLPPITNPKEKPYPILRPAQ